MPLEMMDPEDDDAPRPGGPRFSRSQNPWYRPASTAGRVFLALVALTVLGGFAASAYLLKTFLSRDSRFRIAGTSNIEATGLTEVSRGQMLPVFGEDVGRNIFFVPLNERRKELEEIPWIERATVMRLLPDRIRVSVVERQPVAFVRQGQQIGLVDANGVLLTMPAAMMAQHNYSFPVVTGVNASDPPGERKARMAVYLRLLGELDSNGQHTSQQISEIDLSDTEDLQVVMPEQGGDILLHFGEDRFLERYQHYKAHIAEWRQQFPKLTGVDLRLDPKFVLQMAAGTDVAQAAVNEQSAANAGDSKPTGDQADGIAPSVAKPVSSQPQSTAKAKPGKPEVKGSNGTKNAGTQKRAKTQKATAAKNKAAHEGRKHADARRAALNLNKQKTAPTTPPAISAGQGQ